jgi:uncharacterized protein YjbI with pentapeptide repeats
MPKHKQQLENKALMEPDIELEELSTDVPSLNSLPSGIKELIFSFLFNSTDLKGFKSLARVNKSYYDLAKNQVFLHLINKFKEAEDTLTYIEPLISVSGKNRDTFIAHHNEIKDISDLLNAWGIVEKWKKQQNDVASQLAYVLLTNNVATIPWATWDNIRLFLKQQNSHWPNIRKSVIKQYEHLLIFTHHSSLFSLTFIQNFASALIREIREDSDDKSLFLDYSAADYLFTNLKGVNLGGARLGHLFLQHADLRGAHFQNSTLLQLNMEYADLRGANLENTEFVCHYCFPCNLSYVDFRGANLKNTYFGTSVYLSGANFSGTHLHKTRFIAYASDGINFTHATFFSCRLKSPEIKPDEIDQLKTMYNQQIQKASTLRELKKIEQELDQEELIGKVIIQYRPQEVEERVDWSDIRLSLQEKTKIVANLDKPIDPTVAILIQKHQPTFKQNHSVSNSFWSESNNRQEYCYTLDTVASIIANPKWSADAKNSDLLTKIMYEDKIYLISSLGKQMLDTIENAEKKGGFKKGIQEVYRLALEGYKETPLENLSFKRIYEHLCIYLEAIHPTLTIGQCATNHQTLESLLPNQQALLHNHAQ